VGDKQNQPFQLSFNASLKVDFQGSRVTSDGGLILVRELDERLGFGELIGQHLTDSRRGKNTQLPLADSRRRASKQVAGRKGDGEVYEKPLEMRHFRVFTYPEEPELAPSGAAGVARDGNNKRTASTEAIARTIEGGQEAKSEILGPQSVDSDPVAPVRRSG